MNSISVENLSKEYKHFKLDNLNLSIPNGSVVGLVGANGAGKTTLIKLILGIIKKDSGTINIIDKEEIGIVLDDAFLPDLLKINDISKIMKNIYKNWDEKLFKEYLQKFNLTNNIPIKSLSKGMKKKLEIATSLAHNPKLLILDEPTSGLDPIVRGEVLDIFREFMENDEHSILISSHITSDLENIADYIVLIDNGKIILNKSIMDITDNYGIIHCTKEIFEKLKNKAMNYRKNKYDYEVLIDNKKEIKREYKDLTIDKANIDEMMYLLLRGEKE